jgi:hypothetical protein
MTLLPLEGGMFAVSFSDDDVRVAFGTRVELSQNCYIAQIPGHTNYARSVRQPFSPIAGLRFSREMALATLGPFQILCSPCVIRHEFHDLATLPTQVMAQRNPPIIYTHSVL